MPGDAVDEEIQNRLGGALDVGGRHTPARQMTVDIHAGKAVNHSAACKLHLLQIGLAQLPLREGLRQQPLGHADQFGIVA